MERRALLTGAIAVSAAGLLASQANAYTAELPGDVAAALAQFRKTIPSNFDRDYVENAVMPFFLTSIYEGERPSLPMIDVTLTKQDALPHDLWGLIYKGWKPTPEEGVTVFLAGAWRIAVTTISASGSTSRRSPRTCTARCIRRR